jgi:hypothetical protein
MRAGIFAECQPFSAVCDLELDLGKQVDRVLDECRHAEAELFLGKGDSKCLSKKCFDECGDELQTCTVNYYSGLFECGQSVGSKAWSTLIGLEAKCCGEVSQANYLTEVGHHSPC